MEKGRKGEMERGRRAMEERGAKGNAEETEKDSVEGIRSLRDRDREESDRRERMK